MKTLIVLLLSALSYAYGFLDLEELKASNFDIEILNNPIVFEENVNNLAGSETMRLASVHGQQYHCVLPSKQTAEVLESPDDEKQETGIPELLNPMQDGPCLILTKGWWTYEFCYRRFIKQYHMEDGKIAGDVMFLGYYETDFDWQASPEKSATYRLNRFHSQQYVNGTVCDMTNKPRRTEVRFLCHEDAGDKLVRVEEAETCVYELYVHTMRLCHHPYLRPVRKPPVLTISCSPLLSQHDYDAYVAQKQAELAQLEEDEATFADADDSGILPTVATKTVTSEGVTVVTMDATMNADESSVEQSAKVLSDLFVRTLAKVLAEEEEALAKKAASTEKSGDNEKEDQDGVSDDADKGAAASDTQPAAAASDKLPVQTTDKLVDSNDVTTEEARPASDLDTGGVQHEGEGHTDSFTSEEYTDEDALNEFEEGLNKLDPNTRSRLSKYKDTIDSFVQTQFGNIIDEAEAEVGDIVTMQERLATFKKLSMTLSKLMERLAQAQKDTADIDDELERIKRLRAHLLAATDGEHEEETVHGDTMATSTPASPGAGDAAGGAAKGQSAGATGANEIPAMKVVHVRVQPSYVNMMKQVAASQAEKQSKSESTSKATSASGASTTTDKTAAKTQRKERTLKNIDFKKEVKIITAGYYDEDKKVLHLEPTDQSHAFKKILVAVLGYNTDQAIEQERQMALEDGYNFQLSPQQRRKTQQQQQQHA